MDVVTAASGYISKMVTVGESAGSSKMKILLLDSETVRKAADSISVIANSVVTGSDRLNRHHAVRPP
jgi:hypothetical protein